MAYFTHDLGYRQVRMTKRPASTKLGACRPSLTPNYTHCYDLDDDGVPCAHRVSVMRNWAIVDFVSADGREFTAQLGSEALSQAAVLGLLGYEHEQDLVEIMIGLQQAVGQVMPIGGVLVMDGSGGLPAEVVSMIDFTIEPGHDTPMTGLDGRDVAEAIGGGR